MNNEERKYEDLSAEEKSNLVQSSLAFMRNVTEIWGPTKGMELWNTISSTISTDLQGDLFFGMVTGKYSMSAVTITSFARTDSYVDVIRAVRTATGWGLKEAKDFCDSIRDRRQTRVIEVQGQARDILLNSLRAAGADAT